MCTPYIEGQKMVAMATSFSCRVSTISAFCWLTTQTLLHNQSPIVTIVHTKSVIAKCVPIVVAMGTFLTTSGPHLTHSSLGPSKPTTQTACRSVQPLLQCVRCCKSNTFKKDTYFKLKDDMQRFFTKLIQKSFLAAYCNINPSV